MSGRPDDAQGIAWITGTVAQPARINAGRIELMPKAQAWAGFVIGKRND